MARRPVGHFVGYRQFAVDHKWLAEKRELKAAIERAAWHSKWITVWRLKTDRLWTDWAICQWLGKPASQGKYKVFAVVDVKAAERKKTFKEWHTPRLERKQLKTPFFEIKKL